MKLIKEKFIFFKKTAKVHILFSASNTSDTLHIMKELRTMLLRLKGEFMSEDGSSVDYFSMGKSEAFQNYKELASSLR